MIKKFNDFINEEINIGGFELMSTEYPIEIDTEYEINHRDLYEINKDFLKSFFVKNELIKLNALFGVWQLTDNTYPFKFTSGGFGGEHKEFSGKIEKLKNYDKTTNLTKYIVHLFVKVKVGANRGKNDYILCFPDLDKLVEFFESLKY